MHTRSPRLLVTTIAIQYPGITLLLGACCSLWLAPPTPWERKVGARRSVKSNVVALLCTKKKTSILVYSEAHMMNDVNSGDDELGRALSAWTVAILFLHVMKYLLVKYVQSFGRGSNAMDRPTLCFFGML